MSYSFFKKKATIGFGVISQEVIDPVAKLQVQRYTSDTYVGSTTYTADSFIGLNIVHDDSGEDVIITYNGEQMAYDQSGTFIIGKYMGVDDGTAESGELTISGGYKGWGQLKYSSSKILTQGSNCITRIIQFGNPIEIPDYGFANNTFLTSITLPNSVTTIGSYLIDNCTNLTSINIPNSATSIDDFAFNNCASLTSIMVDNNNINYKSISGNLYSKDGQTLIRYAIGKVDNNFIVPNSVTTIGNSAFSNCITLESIEIQNSVTTIGSSAFQNCTSLTSIEIPNSVTSIGEYVFYSCSSLKSITIPDSVTSIEKYAFFGCSSLESITLPFIGEEPDSTENWYFGYIFGNDSYSPSTETDRVPASLKEVTITGGKIRNQSVRGHKNIEKIKLLKNITFVGLYGTFYGCTSLKIVDLSDIPTILAIDNNTFDNCTALAEILVPFALLEQYKTYTFWVSYADLMIGV